jgi:hypothetical protein
LLALAGIGSAFAAWGAIPSLGFIAALFFVLAALGIHIDDIVRTAGSRVEVLVGEVLGRRPDDYVANTMAFETGRKREFLIDGDRLFFVTRDGKQHHLSAHPAPRGLRATRRVVRKTLRKGDDAVLLIVNGRIIDRLGDLVHVRRDAPRVPLAGDLWEVPGQSSGLD